jgi:hypothetical protein
VRFGVRRLLDFSEPVRTCPNLCEPQIFFASNNNIHQKNNRVHEPSWRQQRCREGEIR